MRFCVTLPFINLWILNELMAYWVKIMTWQIFLLQEHMNWSEYRKMLSSLHQRVLGENIHSLRSLSSVQFFCLFFISFLNWWFRWHGICKCMLSHLDSCSHDTFYRVGPENKCFQFVSSGAGKQVFPVCTVWEWVKKETSITILVNPHFNPTWWSSVC